MNGSQIGSVLLTVAALSTAGYSFSATAVRQPSREWVPFSADFKRVSDGEVITVGRLYVLANGSERRESRNPNSDSWDVIEIRNTSQARFCRWRKSSLTGTGSWTCQPMDVLPGPLGASGRPPGPDVAGVPTVEVVNSRGSSRWLLAPSLSYFPVLRDDGGVVFEVTRVTMDVPNAEVVALPTGPDVKVLTEKGGTVIGGQ